MAKTYYKRDSKGKIVVVPQGIPSSSSSSKSSSSSSTQPTGGMSLATGGSVLVTPGGTVVGSADTPPPKKKTSGGGGGGGSTTTSQTPSGVAVGTGASGGTLITTNVPGQTVEVQQTLPTQLKDTAKNNYIKSGGGGQQITTQLQSTQFNKQEIQDPRINPATGKPYATVSEVKTDRSFSNVFGLQEDITRKRTYLLTKEERGQGNILTGAGSFGLAFLGAGVSKTRAVVNPIETTKGAFSSAVGVFKDPLGSASSAKQSIGYSVRTDPFGFAGGVTGDVLIGAGIAKGVGKGVTKGSDLYRTRGLKEIPMEDIVAPEYLAGQKFPQIKKGQTAGELKSEFEQPLSGFTASGNPLKGTQLGRGSSELPGLYQAPKLSPTFLRVTPGKSPKVFSVKLSETLRPTIFQVKPTEYKLVPGVKPKQSTLFSERKAREFYETSAEKGKAYVPFIKTEKEAVIPFGTEVTYQKDIGYIKFEGRRIPIKEYKTKSGGKTGGNDILPDQKIKTAYDIEKRSSSSRVGKTSRYDPLDVVRFIPSSSSYTPSSSTYIIPGRSSSLSGSRTSSSIIITPTSSYSPPTSSPDYYIPRPRSSTSSYSSGKGDSSYFYSPSKQTAGFILPTNFNIFGSKQSSKASSKFRNVKSGYQASLTSELFNIRGRAGTVSKAGYVNPFQRRVIPISTRLRRSVRRK